MILRVENLGVRYKDRKKEIEIIKDVSFNVGKNRCLGILGESGSGKSMTCKALMGLLEKNFITDGNVYFNEEEILKIDEDSKRKIRGKSICMILQNPMTAFNPLFTIENQVVETFREHLNISKEEARKLAINALDKMNLKNSIEVLKKYPHELSGGMLQRIMIGITMALEPDLIIADEPTTAIDCVNQVDVINELKIMKSRLKTSMIFITHDLGVLSQIADDVIVMDKGRVIEQGSIYKIMNSPNHNHTKYLIDTRYKLLRKFKETLA